MVKERIKVFFRYLANNRIAEYEEIVEAALEADYQVISLRDYAEGRWQKAKKTLFLRHDIDHHSRGPKMMFEVEKKYGVKASYYFRHSTLHPGLMREIEEYGSEASFHFETIADFVAAHGEIKSREDLFQSDFKERCLKILRADLDRLRALLDIPCTTIASHGHPLNRKVETKNNYLTEDEGVYDDLGIKLEAYNREFINQVVTCYISDMPLEINEGYRYGTSPLEAVEREEKCILFLSHPAHWHYSRWRQFKKLAKVILKGPVQSPQEFQRN